MAANSVLDGLTRIDGRLDTMNETIVELNGRLERHLGRSEEVHRMVLRHKELIDGNDGDGLRTRTSIIEDRLESLGDPGRRSIVAQRISVAGVITAVGTAVGTAIATLMGGK